MDSYLVQELDLIASPFECEKSWKIRNAKIFTKKKTKNNYQIKYSVFGTTSLKGPSNDEATVLVV